MTKRIFRSIFLVAFTILLACTALIMSVLYGYFNQIQHQQLKAQTDLVAQAVEAQGTSYLSAVRTDQFRITWIGADGVVLYDSDSSASKMENHLDREEVQDALENGYGESARYSNTMMTKMLYTAERLSDGSVVRVSTGQYSMLSFTVLMLQPIMAMLIAAGILSGVLASRLSKKIVKPLNELNLDDPLANETYEEIAPLLGRIERQHRQINRQIEELHRKQDEFNAVTSSMSEGLALLGAGGEILSINQAAAKLLGADQSAVGRDILTINRSLAVQELLHKAQAGQHAELVLDEGPRTYQFAASPVISDQRVTGVVLLIFDITEKSHAEQLRREFTANVSHELKTPLHSISGCAEIMKNGLVKEADMPQFIDQIYHEAQRLITLVDDIIRLSRLDEGADDMPREEVDLLQTAEDVSGRLSAYAAQQHVAITCTGEHAVISAIPRLINEILYNLCDNAIKYNVEGGNVEVSIAQSSHEAVLRVQDTGIGIPREHQSRVFERFYRVDKSHSKEIGGTGLGLSIVKHAAMIHGASVDLQSSPGKGTIVTVRFPC